ncbi:ABC transporter ATP-binding protein [Eleftheria terrae]|uniref:ABC transporter ATP-binding protein n=1 Tax=Eleftheria terrae TaxID=1597781 RepID=UPI00263A5C4F|nr:ABC transporter ATP-binding protein [Eleftheria terrae]WKB55584.1 ABC transporter ATP-binding protein/permease [Eleftheria terrae]
MSRARSSYGSLWQLLRLARPPGLLLAAATGIAVLSVAGTLGFPVLTRQLVDELAGGMVNQASIVLLAVVMLGSALASGLSSYLLGRVGHEMIAALRSLLIDKLLRLPVASYDEESTGERVSRVLNDCQSISELATRQAINLLTGVLVLAGSVVVLLYLDVRLTLTVLGCVAAAFAVVIPLAGLLEGLGRSTQDRTAKLGGILTHVLSEIRLVKAFTAEARERERNRQEIEDIRRLGFQVAKINAALEPLISLSLTAAVLFILVYGSARVSSGSISIGTLTAFILYIFNVAVPLIQLTNFMAELQKAKGASTRIAALLQHGEEEGREGEAVGNTHGTLEFREVSFSYPGRDAKVLHGINLAFRPGTTTALVGASGNGKTTILSLIERFYAPTEGAVLYDGKPIGDFSLGAWRERIGYVAQSAPIMPGTVRDNILYGLSGAYSDDMVRMAAEKAGALEFIEQMPQGLDTVLSEQGGNLSGGQRQRIAIARMFLRNPDILILDEATSSLDSETEHRVKVALESLMQGRTNIVVAHRLATVIHADRIYFLEGGRISGSGSHEELLNSHPYYARLVARQFRKPVQEGVEPLLVGTGTN